MPASKSVTTWGPADDVLADVKLPISYFSCKYNKAHSLPSLGEQSALKKPQSDRTILLSGSTVQIDH